MGTSKDFSGSPKWGTNKAQITAAASDAMSTEKMQQMLSAFVATMQPAPAQIAPPALPTSPGALPAPASPDTVRPDLLSPGRPEAPLPEPATQPGGQDAPPASLPSWVGGGRGGGGGGGGGSGRSSGQGGKATGGKGGGGRRGGGGARSAARNLGQFITTVAEAGLPQALDDLGVSIEGKSPLEVSEALTEALCGPQSTLDEVAIHNAMSELTAQMLGNATELRQFEASITKAAPSVGSTLTKFFGIYIYQRFCAISYAAVLTKLGAQKAEAAIKQIKGFISSKVANLATERNLAKIDWKGQEGLNLVDQIRRETEQVFLV